MLRCALPWLVFAAPASAEDLPEYRLKAAFVYNFMVFTEWPGDAATSIKLCVVGNDPFGAEIDKLAGKRIAGKSVVVERRRDDASLADCQTVFIAASAIQHLDRLLERLADQPVLTIADSEGAMQRGVQLNMKVADRKVSFEANLEAARRHHLQLSSKLLQLATEVKK